LFGVAVLFIAQEAYFLAAIQVIVYAGAIVILFLFVIMLLGVDRADAMGMDPIAGQRVAGVIAAVAILGLSLAAVLTAGSTGLPGSTEPIDPDQTGVSQLGHVLFTDYIFAVEITAVLLTIAVVGAVVLSRRFTGTPIDIDEFPDGTAADELAEAALADDSAFADQTDQADPDDAGADTEEVAP
jgi:NADH-quinone oxidoreductase subunit J